MLEQAAQRRFLVMAGGTGGHVYPALATARLLLEHRAQVHWLGSRGGMEERIIGDEGIAGSYIRVSGLRGKGRWALLLAPIKLGLAVVDALRVLVKVQPDCVLGMGGFASGPGGLAAWLLRKPLVIHEQNAIPGFTNKSLARFASRVLQAFPGAFKARADVLTVGNPVRADISALPPPQERFRERQGPLRLLVLGGSLGAQAINQLLPQALATLPEAERPQVRHQTGRGQDAATKSDYSRHGVAAEVSPFIEDMRDAYHWADFVVCRAGALTLAELTCAGLGAVLVPFPHAVDDHQTANARYLADAGAAQIIQQRELTVASLCEALAPLLHDRDAALAMANKARQLAQPDAVTRVAETCVEVCRG